MITMSEYIRRELDGAGLRQPRWPKPHIQVGHDGYWYFVDVTRSGARLYRQRQPFTRDPRLRDYDR